MNSRRNFPLLVVGYIRQPEAEEEEEKRRTNSGSNNCITAIRFRIREIVEASIIVIIEMSFFCFRIRFSKVSNFCARGSSFDSRAAKGGGGGFKKRSFPFFSIQFGSILALATVFCSGNLKDGVCDRCTRESGGFILPQNWCHASSAIQACRSCNRDEMLLVSRSSAQSPGSKQEANFTSRQSLEHYSS